MMFEIHPFLRPFDGALKIVKSYDMTGPSENEAEATFAWRVQDTLNGILDSGVCLEHMEELFAEKDYDNPFWISCTDQVNGVAVLPKR